MVNKDFFKQVVAGEKLLLKKAAVKYIAVPAYEELSVKAIWPLMAKDPEFVSYFPDKFPAGKGPPRAYFFNVLNTLQPEYLAKLIAHANMQRTSTDGIRQKNEAIKMSQFWQEELESMPFLSK